MPYKCAVDNCWPRLGRRLLKFPKNRPLQLLWIKNLNLQHLSALSATDLRTRKRVCDRHFAAEDVIPPNYFGSNNRALRPGSVPIAITVLEDDPAVAEVPNVVEIEIPGVAEVDILPVGSGAAAIPDQVAEVPKVSHFPINFYFRGHVAPVFTPFNNDRNKSINFKTIAKYATYLLDNKIKGLLVNGTTGEGMAMNLQERKLVAEEWKKACLETEQMLMVQVGGAPLPDVLELATHAESIKVDAILCLPELYIKPKNADELIRYLNLISKAAPKTPLLYYHIPAFTNVNINMVEFLEKAKDKIDTLVGIKFTSTDLVEGANCLTVNEGKYAIFLGADQLLSAAYTLGFDSAIATTFNIFPHYGYQIFDSIRNKVPNFQQAQEKQRSLTVSINTIIQHGGWVPAMKTAMNIISPINVGPVREPMEQVPEEKMKKIQIPFY